jgi:catechol 2,3-dioxygenase-like lactoylglutathione lyase family enzyme
LTAKPAASIPWQSFHHIAVVTRDLDATIRFYRDLLGMQASGIMGTDARGTAGRHCFIKPGKSRTWGLHFFESPDAGAYPAAGKTDRESLLATVGMQHMAFALPDEEAALALRERLQENGVETTDVGEIGSIRNTLFFDNNGLLLEATWPKP